MRYSIVNCIYLYGINYSRTEDDEEFCDIIEECRTGLMRAEKCRPPSCPFKHMRGCNAVSSCLDPAVINQYRALLGTSK